MKLSEKTLGILTGITRINAKSQVNGAVFKKGNFIRARRYKSDMPVMYATIEEEFPRDFAIFDLPRFIAMFSVMGPDTDLSFEDNYVILKAGKKKAKMRYISEHLLEPDSKFFEREITMKQVDFTCNLDQQTLKSIMDAASMFSAPQISFLSDGEKVVASTYNVKDPKSDKMEVEVGESNGWDFNIIVDVEMVSLLLKRDYTVSFNKAGLIEWKADDVRYYITCSDKSKR